MNAASTTRSQLPRPQGALRQPSKTTLREAWEAGTGAPARSATAPATYKPSALRGYEGAMRSGSCPTRRVRLAELRRSDLRRSPTGCSLEGSSPHGPRRRCCRSGRSIRRALARDELAVNPCSGLHLPAVRGRRERYRLARGGRGPDRCRAGTGTGRSGRRRCTPDCGSANCARSGSRTSTWPAA